MESKILTANNLSNIKGNTDRIFFVNKLRWILSTDLPITISLGKYRQKHFVGIYWENCNAKRMNKKIKKVWWGITFTNGFTNKTNPMVKFIRRYTDKITDGITVGFKKTNRTVTWNVLPIEWPMKWLMK
jgi:hypothetical protein